MSQKKSKKSAGLSALLNPESHLHVLELSTIVESPNNPRTQFDQAAIDELSESIKSVGVIQPIVVRPVADGYELVCGARRYRASRQAGLETIPAVVRELTDEDAFELAITENLQRKDVNALDEAVALLKMKERGYSTAEMAAKLGKSEKYVVQRLKLNDLIDEFKQALFAGKLLITQAYLIARISPDDQREVLSGRFEDWQDESFDPRNVDDLHWYIERSQHKLSDAIFDTESATLFPAAGPCSSCPKNTACATLLFPELDPGKARCTDKSCWSQKEVKHIELTLKSVKDGENLIPINRYYGSGDIAESVQQAARNLDITLKAPINRNSYEFLDEPREPQKPDREDYQFDPEDEWPDYDSQEEADEAYNEALQEYEQDVQRYHNELADYKKAMETGDFVRGLIISCGQDIGKVMAIKLKTDAKDKAAKAAIAESSPELAIQGEIDGIRQREKRAKELDAEKLHAKLVEMFQTNRALKPESYQTFQDRAGTPQLRIVCYLLYDKVDYSHKKEVNEFLGLDSQYTDNEGAWERILGFTDEYVMTVINYLLHVSVFNSFKNHLPHHAQGRVLRYMMEHNMPTLEVEQAQAEIIEKAEKRSARADERIAALEAKLQKS